MEAVENKISPQVYKDAADALKIAKISMMMQKATVFYTTILFSLKQGFDETLPTAATDGKDLSINPAFFMSLPPVERIGLLAHEVLHVALDHMHRMGKRDAIVTDSTGRPISLWNIAADYVINDLLSQAGYHLPPGGLNDSQYSGKSTEQVYDILYKKTDKQKSDLADKCGNNSGADVQFPQDAKGDPVSQDHVTEIILRASTQAKSMGQAAGSIPGEVGISLQEVINPPLPWHIILQNYLTEFAKEDYTWRRPNRRFLPNFYMPTAHSEAIANIAIAVDCSCSVSDHEFNVFITKIAEIQDAMHPKKITVVPFDTRIGKVQELTDDDNPFKKLRFTGRGGTQIKPVHDWAAENKPTVLLVFSDGEFSQPAPKDKSIPIVWVIHDDKKWAAKHGGRVIHYNIT